MFGRADWLRRLIDHNNATSATSYSFYHQFCSGAGDHHSRNKRDTDGGVYGRYGRDLAGQFFGYQRGRCDREPNGDDDLYAHSDSDQWKRGDAEHNDHRESRADD